MGNRRIATSICTSTANNARGGDQDIESADELQDLSPGEAAQKIEQERKPKGIWGRVKYFFIGERLDRKRLAALGTSRLESSIK